MVKEKQMKQTEIGLIPEDWEVVNLGEILLKNPDYGINAAAVKFKFSLPTYLRITDIDENGNFIRDNLSSVENINSASYYLGEGDIVFARTGASVGKTYLYKSADGDLVFAGFLIRIQPNIKLTSSKFLFYNTQTKMYKDWIISNSMRSGQPGINSNEIKTIQIPLPPLAEQEAIAASLSDCDAWVESLEAVIAKKRLIKQGAMQELLTPKEDWEVKKLGEITEIIIGLTYSPNDVRDFGTLVLRSSNVQNNKLAFENNVFVQMDLPQRVIVKENDILVCVRNGSKQLIGKCALIDKKTEGQAFGAFMSIIRSQFGKYLFHYFQTNHIQVQVDENLGATINQLTSATLKSFNIYIPKTLSEQTRIVMILSDMDAELEALGQKLNKARQIKQGMMQELLTGRVRLV